MFTSFRTPLRTSFRFAARWLTAPLVLALAACGSGGGGGGEVLTPVTGFVSKAPVTGATCRLYNAANQVVG